ncbi:hypothetical protein C8F04DRAFT_1302137 [Mycena alexandri]|uniref:Uncharacterized protein n=1 Tax=Mycena alexandri TaxID=1745969 RepID=A0AAD6T887_9AGAR|nr:hypothetical protein C8F04DRAFT_1302137 [Mycena alexandri]
MALKHKSVLPNPVTPLLDDPAPPPFDVPTPTLCFWIIDPPLYVKTRPTIPAHATFSLHPSRPLPQPAPGLTPPASALILRQPPASRLRHPFTTAASAPTRRSLKRANWQLRYPPVIHASLPSQTATVNRYRRKGCICMETADLPRKNTPCVHLRCVHWLRPSSLSHHHLLPPAYLHPSTSTSTSAGVPRPRDFNIEVAMPIPVPLRALLPQSSTVWWHVSRRVLACASPFARRAFLGVDFYLILHHTPHKSRSPPIPLCPRGTRCLVRRRSAPYRIKAMISRVPSASMSLRPSPSSYSPSMILFLFIPSMRPHPITVHARRRDVIYFCSPDDRGLSSRRVPRAAALGSLLGIALAALTFCILMLNAATKPPRPAGISKPCPPR